MKFQFYQLDDTDQWFHISMSLGPPLGCNGPRMSDLVQLNNSHLDRLAATGIAGTAELRESFVPSLMSVARFAFQEADRNYQTVIVESIDGQLRVGNDETLICILSFVLFGLLGAYAEAEAYLAGSRWSCKGDVS